LTAISSRLMVAFFLSCPDRCLPFESRVLYKTKKELAKNCF
jgi:hypothetical protein